MASSVLSLKEAVDIPFELEPDIHSDWECHSNSSSDAELGPIPFRRATLVQEPGPPTKTGDQAIIRSPSAESENHRVPNPAHNESEELPVPKRQCRTRHHDHKPMMYKTSVHPADEFLRPAQFARMNAQGRKTTASIEVLPSDKKSTRSNSAASSSHDGTTRRNSKEDTIKNDGHSSNTADLYQSVSPHSSNFNRRRSSRTSSRMEVPNYDMKFHPAYDQVFRPATFKAAFRRKERDSDAGPTATNTDIRSTPAKSTDTNGIDAQRTGRISGLSFSGIQFIAILSLPEQVLDENEVPSMSEQDSPSYSPPLASTSKARSMNDAKVSSESVIGSPSEDSFKSCKSSTPTTQLKDASMLFDESSFELPSDSPAPGYLSTPVERHQSSYTTNFSRFAGLAKDIHILQKGGLQDEEEREVDAFLKTVARSRPPYGAAQSSPLSPQNSVFVAEDEIRANNDDEYSHVHPEHTLLESMSSQLSCSEDILSTEELENLLSPVSRSLADDAALRTTPEKTSLSDIAEGRSLNAQHHDRHKQYSSPASDVDGKGASSDEYLKLLNRFGATERRQAMGEERASFPLSKPQPSIQTGKMISRKLKNKEVIVHEDASDRLPNLQDWVPAHCHLPVKDAPKENLEDEANFVNSSNVDIGGPRGRRRRRARVAVKSPLPAIV